MSNADDRARGTGLARILESPQLARMVPHLRPEMLHRVIERYGLADCAELVSLATPAQLNSVLDLDLWRSGQAGLDEQFDVSRFGQWLEMLVDAGAGFAAATIARLDIATVTAGFARQVRVFDAAALSALEIDGEFVDPTHMPDGDLTAEIGGYLIIATEPEAWDAIVSALTALETDQPDRFHLVMRGCRRMSDSRPEIDGLDNLLMDPEQAMFDLSVDRERRRQRQGYATPPDARAFLQLCREQDPQSHDDGVAASNHPIVRAYFDALDDQAAADEETAPDETDAASAVLNEDPAAAAPLVEALVEDGVLVQASRALPASRETQPQRLALIRQQLDVLREQDESAYMRRTHELVFLANTLAAGCPVQMRAFTLQEASDAALAVCNLGLQRWPAPLPDDFLARQDLVGVFHRGWHVLYREVCLGAAHALLDVLAHLSCSDRDVQAGLDALRVNLTKHVRVNRPWRAGDDLDVLAGLDLPAWAGLLGLIAEYPVLHPAVRASLDGKVRSVDPRAFELISDDAQVQTVGRFLARLQVFLGE